ncbi:MFS transporter [Streptomyces solincola]|nr:MFS transporter [Streptomyces solincola]
MVLLDQTVVTVALPSMGRDLGLSMSSLQWVVNGYILALAAFVAFGGRLGVVLGEIRAFQVGVGLFAAASVVCGLAPGNGAAAEVIVAARVVQGLGAAVMLPTAQSLVANAFPTGERGRALALYTGSGQVLAALGPLVGGVLTQWISWRAVFFVNVPVAAAALLLLAASRPERTHGRRTSMSVPQLTTLIAGLALLVLGTQQASVWGFASALTWTVLGAGALGIACFIRLALRSERPVIDIRLLGIRRFRRDAVLLFILQFGTLAAMVHGTLFLQETLDYSAIASGLAILPLIVPLIVANQIAGRAFDKHGARVPTVAGFIAATAGVGAWAWSFTAETYWWQVPGMTATGIGIGCALSCLSADGLSVVAAESRGEASGILACLRQLGGSVGVAAAATVALAAHGSRTDFASVRSSTAALALCGVVLALGLALALFLGSRTARETSVTRKA